MTPDIFNDEERYRAFQVDYAEWDVNTSKKRTRSEVKQKLNSMEPVFDSPSHPIDISDIVIENESEKPKVDDFWLKHVK